MTEMTEKPYKYKVKIKCGLCDGTGQETEWGHNNSWSIHDCSDCNATGKVEIEVSDFRKIATKRTAIIPSKS